MATTFQSQTYASDNTTAVFDVDTDGIKATTFVVSCDAASAVGAFVFVEGLHSSGEDGFYIAPGDSQPFRRNNGGITSVVIKGDGGTCTCTGGVVAVS